MRYIFRSIIVLLFLIVRIDAFVISGEESCDGHNVYQYAFDKNAIIPFLSVQVSSNALIPDITMKLVDDPKDADLIFIDNLLKSDMKICKKHTLFDTKTIKVGENIIVPDITIKLARNPMLPDYKIYIHSYTFSKEEVATIFAIIWKNNRKHN